MEIENFLPQDAYAALNKISSCQTEAEVAAVTKQVVIALGATSYVYSTLTSDDRRDDRESYRYSIGCDPQWCRIYNERKWFMNDPFIEYSRHNTEPVMADQIVLQTSGQIEMMRVAATYGFKSGMVIPTHSSQNANERIGLLYIGVDQPPEIGNQLVYRHRISYRALGMELLDWWIRFLRANAARKFNLSEEEIVLLQQTKNGFAVTEISAKLGSTPSKLYRQLSVIKDKFNVDKIGDAVAIASFNGLLG
ncbi:helix-turn-helix transcriptional regulator [Collimonas silvisoli]|uniref:helix-turn-helix transcriptional regulator n=1 Tax=Collimonas silvisoli TaxID=2825884 RepID=UPI001B8C1875|nr:autoinducer binding domain-containing protein [Collimonas silvisoli]